MNFKESKTILEKIKNAKTILLSLHQSPDLDSISSNVLMSRFLSKIDKKWTLVSPNKIPHKFKLIYNLTDKNEVDISKLDMSKFDLFLALDVSQPERFGLQNSAPIEVVNIDHHFTKNGFDGVKIIDSNYSSTAEMIYYLFEDFEYKMNSAEADIALLGIISDTSSFSYGSSSRVFLTVSKLIELGANYDKVDEIIYRNNSLDQMKYWSKALANLKIDKKHRFAYIALDLKTTKRFPNVLQSARTVADKFVRTLRDTDFGIIMTETEEGYLKISVRSRTSEFGVDKLLVALNGGGHFTGGGGRIDLPYKEAVKETLRITRRFVKDKLKDAK